MAGGSFRLWQATESQLDDTWPTTWYTFTPTKAYLWGMGANNGLGLGSTANKSSPTQLGSSNWSNISFGQYFGLGVASDGTLWSWGNNSYGKLGLNNTTNYSSPKQVGALTTWLTVSAGYIHSTAIKTDGTLWVWGNNYGSILGLGNTTNYSSPKQLGALTTWKNIVANQYGSNIAIKTDGTLWAWGGNYRGLLGLGDTTSRSSPVQVGLLTNWKTLASTGEQNANFSAVIKTDGTLWVWGDNQYGQLGLGNLTSYSSPKQLGLLTTWNNLTINKLGIHAITTDNKLWGWGKNTNGRLGLGNSTNYSSPKQIGILTNWLTVAANYNNTAAVKTDGTLWTWGSNSYGQLGLNNASSTYSPVQVGSLTTWKSVVGGMNKFAGFTT